MGTTWSGTHGVATDGALPPDHLKLLRDFPMLFLLRFSVANLPLCAAFYAIVAVNGTCRHGAPSSPNVMTEQSCLNHSIYYTILLYYYYITVLPYYYI